MVRWEPGARERLRETALDLYAEHGFEETTVSQIAAAVGLTERTFFRHFADKREVLFTGSEVLLSTFVEGVVVAPREARPLEIVASAVLGAAGFFAEERREYSRKRQTVIVANPELMERELLKMAALAAALSEALRTRGVPEPAATLAAESGVTVFRVSFEQWIDEGSIQTLVEIERSVFEQLGALVGTSVL